MPGAALVNTGDPELEYAFYEAERRVLEIQAKLHRWAVDDPHRRFDDLFNLVADPGFLLVAWVRYLLGYPLPSLVPPTDSEPSFIEQHDAIRR